MVKKALQKLGSKVYLAAYGKSEAVAITFGNDASSLIDAVDYAEGNGKARPTQAKYWKRGKSDNKLLEMHSLADDSPNKWQIIETRGAFIAGLGFRLFKVKGEGTKEIRTPHFPKEFSAYLDGLEIDDYLEAACMQLSFSDEINVRMVLGLDENKKTIVTALDVVDNNDIRAVVPDSGGRIEKFWVSEKFGYNKTVQQDDCVMIPAFDPKEPTKYPVSIIHIIGKKPGQKIYGLANWWGGKKWTAVANKVPDFYDAAFKNGFFVTHHISFPDDYFDQEDLDEEAIEKLKEETLNAITDTLSSVDEANKIVITFNKIAADGRGTLREVKITPIPNPIKDEAFIKMFEAANLVQASGHGVPGKLAGVQLGSDMGSSGKEISAEAAYMQDFLTVFDRRKLCKPLKIAMGIDQVFQDYELGILRIDSYVEGSTAKNDVSHPDNNGV